VKSSGSQTKQTVSGWLTRASNLNSKLRWETSAVRFIAAISLVNALLYHKPLYAFAVSNLDVWSANGLLTLTTLFIVIFIVTAVTLFLVTLLTYRLVKPICIFLALANSIALYFVGTYQVVLDRTMMGNVFNTSTAEAASYFSPKLLLYVLVFGVVPSWFLKKTRVQKSARLHVALLAIATACAGLGWSYVAASTWLWIDDNASKLGGMVMPWSYVSNSVRNLVTDLRSSREPTLLPAASFTNDDKMVVILVIGEAARSSNFSLYGYGRPTNPLMSESGAVALKNTVACATYTTASLRCILSPEDGSSPFAKNLEPLPSYLYRNGVDVIWRTRNWGEPPIHVANYQHAKELREHCDADCDYDGVLLAGLLERIESSKQKKVFVVLHQKGSHGPSYNLQYPERFAVFKPVCKSVELQNCSSDSLLNAYDNTILYGDYFLNETVRLLSSLEDTPTLLMYISDHGESLGEFGLYLHGTPFSIAPDVQKDVPFIVWMSKAFVDEKGISVADLELQQHHSQLDVFHSVMGAFGMRSDVYNSALDIFSPSESN
jgi:lipid A ethanolaminephosphotransferase